ncbi:hypothetical protein UACE39S_01446 [Ureibacillus acetophenoni]
MSNEELVIKFISQRNLTNNKTNIIELLKDNYRLNFPNIDDLENYASNGYDDMVRFNNDNSAILIGAFDGEDIVVGLLWAYKRVIFKEVRLHIGHIVVSSKLRSSGIGSKLLEQLENFAKNESINKIELMASIDNENTMKFYNKKGYSIVRVQLEKEIGEITNVNG